MIQLQTIMHTFWMMYNTEQTCSRVDGHEKDVPVTLMTGKVFGGAVLMRRSPGRR
jgi:hypothetical protein